MKTPDQIGNYELLKAAFPDCRTLDQFLRRNGGDVNYIYTAFEMLRKAELSKKRFKLEK